MGGPIGMMLGVGMPDIGLYIQINFLLGFKMFIVCEI
jgi:hypothetical protein